MTLMAVWIPMAAFNDNANYGDKKYKLTSNIVLNTGDLTGWNGEGTPEWKIWMPIGYYDSVYVSNSKPFKGTFDGQGHTVSGIYINNNLMVQGLFGYVIDATIRNVGVINSYIKGDQYIGGVCSHNSNGEISNCYNTGTVDGTSNVGGVCGENVDELLLTVITQVR